MNRQKRLLCILLMAVLVGVSFTLFKPGIPVRVGMTEKEVEQVLGRRGADITFVNGKRLPARGKTWTVGADVFDIEFDNNGRVIAVERLVSGGIWGQVRAWLGF